MPIKHFSKKLQLLDESHNLSRHFEYLISGFLFSYGPLASKLVQLNELDLNFGVLSASRNFARVPKNRLCFLVEEVFRCLNLCLCNFKSCNLNLLCLIIFQQLVAVSTTKRLSYAFPFRAFDKFEST